MKAFIMKNLLTKFIFLFSLLAIPHLASAELIIINGNSWDKEVSGKIRDNATLSQEVDLKSDLFLQDKKESFVVAYIEHPVPVLPNIRLGSTSMNHAGSGTLTRSFTYNNQTFTLSEAINTRLNLDHTEVALYWNILDNVVGFDLGLNAKFFDGSVYMNVAGGNTVNEAFDETVPMLYGGLQIELPYGFQIAGDVSYISFDGSSFTDTLIRLRWTSDFHLGVEVGHRSFVIDYEDTDANEYVDIDISGPYAGVHLAF